MRRLEVDCRGATAIVDDDGTGPPVVMVGAASPRSLAARASAGLVARGFRVVNFDYGPPDGWHGTTIRRSAVDQAHDVLDVMDAVELDRAHAIGISRGAITAYALAAREPERIDHLVLLVPVAPFAAMLRPAEAPPSRADINLATVFGRDLGPNDRALALAIMTVPDGTVGRLERQAEEAVDDDEIVTRPTLIVEAGQDVVVSADHPARLRRAMPAARSVRFPDARHGSLAVDVDDLVRCVADFLEDRDATDASAWQEVGRP